MGIVHESVGGTLTQTEFEAANSHKIIGEVVFDSDVILSRIAANILGLGAGDSFRIPSDGQLQFGTDVALSRLAANVIGLTPGTSVDAMARLELLGAGVGTGVDRLMSWISVENTPIRGKENLVFSAFQDPGAPQPHFEIAVGADIAAGGVKRPLVFFMNQENPQVHLEVMRILTTGDIQVFAGRLLEFRDTSTYITDLASTVLGVSNHIRFIASDGRLSPNIRTGFMNLIGGPGYEEGAHIVLFGDQATGNTGKLSIRTPNAIGGEASRLEITGVAAIAGAFWYNTKQIFDATSLPNGDPAVAGQLYYTAADGLVRRSAG